MTLFLHQARWLLFFTSFLPPYTYNHHGPCRTTLFFPHLLYEKTVCNSIGLLNKTLILIIHVSCFNQVSKKHNPNVIESLSLRRFFNKTNILATFSISQETEDVFSMTVRILTVHGHIPCYCVVVASAKPVEICLCA